MNTWQQYSTLDLLKLLESIEQELAECPKCRRNNYLNAPWIAVRDIRLLANETKRLIKELDKAKEYFNLQNQI